MITEDVRKYAVEQGVREEEALKKGMEEKSKEFVNKGAEVYQSLKSKDSSRWEASEKDFA